MRRHRLDRSGLGLAVLVPLLSLPLAAQGDGADDVKTLTQEFDKANREWSKTFSSAPENERAALLAQRPKPETWFPKFWKIADAAPATEAGAQATIWIVSHASPAAADLERGLGVLQEHHMQRADLEEVCSTLARVPTTAATQFLRQLEAKSPHVEVKGAACFNLADSLKDQASMARSLQNADAENIKDLVHYFGRQTVDVLKSADADDIEEEAADLYEKIALTPEYAALNHYRGNLAKAAKGNLFELHNLAIGKPAPEIEGEDIDGNPMKLSDYRGKVVVLDFWGDW